jgi:mannose-6-phosphate isomerase-like protein (cupin superfamily)
MSASVRPANRTSPLHLGAAAAGLADVWSPRVAARINDVLVKVVKIDGEFVWHNHPDTDEAFLCLEGTLTIDLRDGEPEQERSVTLAPGELYVIERGIFHRPHTADGATVALLEAAGVVNTGAAAGALTAPVDQTL